jgi:DNA topoisomerase VI subunit A
MPLKFADDGTLKRTPGRPSSADREFERRLRAAAAADLARMLDPTLDDINSQFVPGTTRYRKGPPELAGRSAKFIGLVASGISEEDARVATKLQRRALRRLLATSPLFKHALASAKVAAAVLTSGNSQNALGALNAPECVDTHDHEQGH